MESTFHKISALYKEMGPSEKKIADYLINHASEAISLSITDLAAKSASGEATIVRFSKRLGFAGFQAMKLQLAKEIGSNSTLSGEIDKNDSAFDIFCKRVGDISLSLRNTQSVLDPDKFETVVEKIMSARRVAVFGLGNSAAIATDAAHKFLRLGIDAISCSDNHLQAIIASHLTGDCVAIGISHSGASKDIVEALDYSRLAGAFTVALTNYAESPIVKKADVTLFTKSEETTHSILGLSSRIAVMTIIDSIYSAIVVRADRQAEQAIFNTEAALKNKKY